MPPNGYRIIGTLSSGEEFMATKALYTMTLALSGVAGCVIGNAQSAHVVDDAHR